MNKYMTKLTMLALSSGLVLAVLGGCGGGNSLWLWGGLGALSLLLLGWRPAAA